jgi:hypothetical protein
MARVRKSVKIIMIGLGGMVGGLLILGGLVMGPLLLGCRGPLVSDVQGTVAQGQAFGFSNFASADVEGGKGITYERKEYSGKGLVGPCVVLTLHLPGGRSLKVSDEGVGNNALNVGGKRHAFKGLSEHLRIAADGTVTVVTGAPHPAIPQLIPGIP